LGSKAGGGGGGCGNGGASIIGGPDTSHQKTEGVVAVIPKSVQERLGHSSITMTMDVYGHLFPRGDDAEELNAAEQALLA
jgi:integrase